MNGSSARPKLSVVIPVFNEKATVAEVLRRVRQVDIDKEIVVVDDGSTDGTREFLSSIATPDASGIASGHPRRCRKYRHRQSSACFCMIKIAERARLCAGEF